MSKIYLGNNSLDNLNLGVYKVIYDNIEVKPINNYFDFTVYNENSNYTIELSTDPTEPTNWGDGTINMELSHEFVANSEHRIISSVPPKTLNYLKNIRIKDCYDCTRLFYFSPLNTEENSNILQKFIFGNNITLCQMMFFGVKFTSLPSEFKLPNTIQNGIAMFQGGELTSLPNNFKLPKSIIKCNMMFAMNKLVSFPESIFVIPENVDKCNGIFKGNTNLTGVIDIKSTKLTTTTSIKDMILNTQISEIRVPTAFPLTDDEIKANCGKSDIVVTRY